MSQPNTDVLDLKQILVQFNSKCIDIYEARHTYSTAELITADLDKEYGITLAKIEELYVLKSFVEEAIESARVDGMFIEWNGLNLMNIADFRTQLNLNKES